MYQVESKEMSCKVLESMAFTKSQVYKMDSTVEVMYACKLAKSPCLLIGNPGTAKSHVSKAIANQYGERDKDWFYQSITAKTSPEKLIGGLIAERMLEGIEEYNLSVGMASKVGNILDEVYKSQHPAMMNTLLAYFDESPTVFSGGKNVTPAYQWLFATTNFEDLPEDLKYDPLWDRFGAKVIVKNLSHSDSKNALKQSLTRKTDKTKQQEFKLTVDDLTKARGEALKLQITDNVIDFFYEKLLPTLEKECYVSQRKINSIFVGKPGYPSILQACAYIEGQEITSSTLRYIPYFCWQDCNSLDSLLKTFEQATISPIVVAYKGMQKQLEEFVASCNAGVYTYEIAKDKLAFISDTIKTTRRAFTREDEVRELPPAMREKLNALTQLAKESIDALIQPIDDEDF